MSSAKLNAVGQRWVNELADYQFTIKYRPGKENVDADFLSRKPTEIAELKEKCTMTIESHSWSVIKSGVEEASSEDGSPVLCMGMSAERLVLDPEVKVVPVAAEELGNKQRGDSIIGPVYRAVAEGSRPSRKEWGELSHESKLLMKNYGKLFLDNGVLMRKAGKYEQLVLPQEYHQMVFVELHEKMAHLGAEKVIDLARQRFHWPKMASSIKTYIQKKM